MINYEERYGDTRPFAKLCEEFSIPKWVGWSIADRLINDRITPTYGSANLWLIKNKSLNEHGVFIDSIQHIAKYLRPDIAWLQINLEDKKK